MANLCRTSLGGREKKASISGEADKWAVGTLAGRRGGEEQTAGAAAEVGGAGAVGMRGWGGEPRWIQGRGSRGEKVGCMLGDG